MNSTNPTIRGARSKLAALCLLVATALGLAFIAKESHSQEPATGSQPTVAKDRFTGSLTVRQKGGGLFYQIYVVRGKVVGGFDAWHGNATHYHNLVGGWYDGRQMVLLVQSTQNDVGDKWYSHAHHFEKAGDNFVLKHTLYGFGKSIDTGEVFTPHVIEELQELSADEVQRLAAPSERALTTPKSPEPTRALTKRLQRLERENDRLKQLIGELILEKKTREDKTSSRQ